MKEISKTTRHKRLQNGEVEINPHTTKGNPKTFLFLAICFICAFGVLVMALSLTLAHNIALAGRYNQIQEQYKFETSEYRSACPYCEQNK